VLKERESAISIVENIVKTVFETKSPAGANGSPNNIRAKQGAMIVPVGIK
jgi:hypothetical protein